MKNILIISLLLFFFSFKAESDERKIQLPEHGAFLGPMSMLGLYLISSLQKRLLTYKINSIINSAGSIFLTIG